MNELSSFFIAVLIAAPFAQGAPACGGHGDRNSMVVKPAWLAEHLKDPNLVVLGMLPPGAFDKGHIPGSKPVTFEDIAVHIGPTGLMLELLPADTLARNLEKLGISSNSRVILYSNAQGVSQMTRVYMTLDTIGLGVRTSILDGGLDAWTSEGHPTTTDAAPVKQGKLEPCAQNDVVVDLDFMKSNLHKTGVDILDVRTAASHASTEPSKNSRPGHIPGAASLPFEKLFDSGKLKPVDELQKIFADAGVKKGDRVVAYCYIGQRATAVYFVARYLGYDARLFDGSWEEWNKHEELPVEISAKKIGG